METNPNLRRATMQITLDIPDPLAVRLNTLPDPQRFIVGWRAQSLDRGLDQDQWHPHSQRSRALQDRVEATSCRT